MTTKEPQTTDQYKMFYTKDIEKKKETHQLNEKEAHEIVRLRVPVVYTAIKQEGEDELARPVSSLWWSGLAAGLAIFFSVVASGAFEAYLHDTPAKKVLVPLGYSLGFLMVILGRLQLFTENTITAVIPLLSKDQTSRLPAMLRLWSVVFIANMVGVFIAAAATVYTNIFPPELVEGIWQVSHHYIDRDAWAFFTQGIPAGFIVAALVWMLPSTRGGEFWVIIMMTYMIALLGLTHVIAGSGEVFFMMFNGEISLVDTLFVSILPTLFGNVIGGTVLFTMLAYAQVKEEL